MIVGTMRRKDINEETRNKTFLGVIPFTPLALSYVLGVFVQDPLYLDNKRTLDSETTKGSSVKKGHIQSRASEICPSRTRAYFNNKEK